MLSGAWKDVPFRFVCSVRQTHLLLARDLIDPVDGLGGLCPPRGPRRALACALHSTLSSLPWPGFGPRAGGEALSGLTAPRARDRRL